MAKLSCLLLYLHSISFHVCNLFIRIFSAFNISECKCDNEIYTYHPFIITHTFTLSHRYFFIILDTETFNLLLYWQIIEITCDRKIFQDLFRINCLFERIFIGVEIVAFLVWRLVHSYMNNNFFSVFQLKLDYLHIFVYNLLYFMIFIKYSQEYITNMNKKICL